MEKLNFKAIASKIVLILTVSFSLYGCADSLKQQARTVRVAPVSEQYQLCAEKTRKIPHSACFANSRWN